MTLLMVANYYKCLDGYKGKSLVNGLDWDWWNHYVVSTEYVVCFHNNTVNILHNEGKVWDVFSELKALSVWCIIHRAVLFENVIYLTTLQMWPIVYSYTLFMQWMIRYQADCLNSKASIIQKFSVSQPWHKMPNSDDVLYCIHVWED